MIVGDLFQLYVRKHSAKICKVGYSILFNSIFCASTPASKRVNTLSVKMEENGGKRTAKSATLHLTASHRGSDWYRAVTRLLRQVVAA